MLKKILTAVAILGIISTSALAVDTGGSMIPKRVLNIHNFRTTTYSGDIIHVYGRNLSTGTLSGDMLSGHIAANGDFRNIDVNNFDFDPGCKFNFEADFRDGAVQKILGFSVCGNLPWNTND